MKALAAGRVGKPHGLDGSFHVTRPRARLLDQGTPVTVAEVQTVIVRRAGTDDRPIVRLDGHQTREAALALRGQDLWVARSDAPALESDEHWAEDFAGLAVVDGDRAVGVVERLLAYPACEVLEVRRPDDSLLLVPLAGDAVRVLDVPGGRVDVDLAFLGEA